MSKDGNITPEKACKSRQMQFRDKTAMFGVFAIEEPGSPVPALYATLVDTSRQIVTWTAFAILAMFYI